MKTDSLPAILGSFFPWKLPLFQISTLNLFAVTMVTIRETMLIPSLTKSFRHIHPLLGKRNSPP